VGYKPPEGILIPPKPNDWNTIGFGPSVVHIGAAVQPAGSGATQCSVRDSIEDTGWVGHGSCHAAFADVGGTVVREERFAVFCKTTAVPRSLRPSATMLDAYKFVPARLLGGRGRAS
jgi:hypothetical protein